MLARVALLVVVSLGWVGRVSAVNNCQSGDRTRNHRTRNELSEQDVLRLTLGALLATYDPASDAFDPEEARAALRRAHRAATRNDPERYVAALEIFQYALIVAQAGAQHWAAQSVDWSSAEDPIQALIDGFHSTVYSIMHLSSNGLLFKITLIQALHLTQAQAFALHFADMCAAGAVGVTFAASVLGTTLMIGARRLHRAQSNGLALSARRPIPTAFRCHARALC